MEEKLTWESARTKCKDDGGDMICFRDTQERDNITSISYTILPHHNFKLFVGQYQYLLKLDIDW